MNRPIDLNADLGEGFPHDEALLDRVTSASVACGAHAGDPVTILRTLRAAKARGVVVGAHPGYFDRQGFGRRDEDHSAEEVARLIHRQIDAVRGINDDAGVPWRFLKPHGALYNQAQRLDSHAMGVVHAARDLELPVLGQPGGAVERWAERLGVRFVAEGFADRRYEDDGRLLPRSHPDAILTDPDAIEAQVLRLHQHGLATLCIHGDQPGAEALAEMLRAIMARRGITIQPFLRTTTA